MVINKVSFGEAAEEDENPRSGAKQKYKPEELKPEVECYCFKDYRRRGKGSGSTGRRDKRAERKSQWRYFWEKESLVASAKRATIGEEKVYGRQLKQDESSLNENYLENLKKPSGRSERCRSREKERMQKQAYRPHGAGRNRLG